MNKPWYKKWWGILTIILFLWPFFLTYWIWKKKWNIKLRVVLISVFWLFILIIGISSNQSNYEPSKISIKQVDNPTQQPTPTPSPQIKHLSHQDTPVYMIRAEKWQSVVITPGATKDEVLLLAKELHKNNPDIHYNIFDDNKELQAYIKWEISQNDSAVYYPEDWDTQHYVGMINLMLTTKGMRWQFTSDSEKYLGTVSLE